MASLAALCERHGLTPLLPTDDCAGADDAPLARRIEDAHANCLENLPVFAVIVLTAAALGRLPAVDALAPWVLYARIGQSAAHLWGVAPLQVLVRAGFWAVQLGLFVWMLARLLA